MILRALVVQLGTLVARPIAYVWAITVLSGLSWADEFLVAMGLLPIFAVVDVYFQSVARRKHISTPSSGGVPHLALWSAIAACAGAVALLSYGVLSEQAWYLVLAFSVVHLVGGWANLHESRFASSEAVFDQAVFEILGYVLCIVIIFLGNRSVAAVLVSILFPLARFAVLLKYQHAVRSSIKMAAATNASSAFVPASIAAQILASVAASAPSLLVLMSIATMEKLGQSLIIFKVVLAVASALSTAVNLFGSRVFYGNIRLDWASSSEVFSRIEVGFRWILAFLAVAALSSLPTTETARVVLAAAVGFGLAYLNLVSSLAYARGRPIISAQAQSLVVTGCFSLALFLCDGIGVSVVLFLFFVAATAFFHRRIPLSELLSG